MANPQEPPARETKGEPEAVASKASQKMIVLADDAGRRLDETMKPPVNLLTLRLGLAVDAADAASALKKCQAGDFCVGDIEPPKKMRIDRPVDFAGLAGTATFEPGKVKLSIPLGAPLRTPPRTK